MDDELFYLGTGHRLRVALVEASMTQAELAEKSDLSPNTVNRHVNGKPITVGALARYAKVLGVDPSTLLPRLDSNQQPTGYGIAAA